MTDTLDFVKNLWGSMGVVPGIAAPTLSVDELDKKINDLKAVEAWLNLNSSMVRGSIQALEVQRNTIATLKSMGKSLATAVQQPGEKDTKSLFESIPYASAFFQHAAEALQPGAPGPAPKEAKEEAKPEVKTEVKAEAPAPAAEAAPASAAPAQAPAGANDAMAAAGLANPSVWWNLLQEQFKQAVTSAMSAEAVTGAAARATEAATKFAQAATQAATKPLNKAAAAAQAATASAPVVPGKEAAPEKKAARKPAAKKAVKPAAK
ncbi:PhaM family polyhydroxyalkanoate granule multifunctional regulatory protein [Pseudoduganella ginsengisoli]|nr:PhaM family polyhydroxyalkanoate granule multifunctional regulatory protein [Pseudoduganella ginsengisoli]